MRLKRVVCENFRTLHKVDLALRDLTVIVGPNGAGKSSLLQLLAFLGSSATQGQLAGFLSSYGGFHAAKSLYQNVNRMRFGLEFFEHEDETVWSYSLTLDGAAAGGFQVHLETLEAFGKPPEKSRIAAFMRGRDGFEVIPKRTEIEALAQIGVFGFTPTEPSISSTASLLPNGHCFTDALGRYALWRAGYFLPDGRVRAPQQIRPVGVPASDGTDLYSALYSLKTTNKVVFRELLENVRLAIPLFEDVEFPPVGAGYVYMAWKQRDLAREIDAGQLSDGTLRLLWLLTILAYAPPDGLIMIDEPELSLHPQWIQLLVALLRKKSAKTTIVVATQSAEFLRWLEPNELLIADLTEEGAKFTWADERPDIRDWLEDFTLSQLWTMGELGGRR